MSVNGRTYMMSLFGVGVVGWGMEECFGCSVALEALPRMSSLPPELLAWRDPCHASNIQFKVPCHFQHNDHGFDVPYLHNNANYYCVTII